MMNYAQVLEQIEQLKIGKKVPETDVISKKDTFKKILYIPAEYEYDLLGEYVEAILKEHKFSVGRFTPYAMKRPPGCIRYNGKAISQKEFSKYGERILLGEGTEKKAEKLSGQASDTEMYLEIALAYFADKKADYLILPSDKKTDFNEFKETLTDSPVVERNKKSIEAAICFLKREGFLLKENITRKAVAKCKCEGNFELLKKKPYYLADGADSGTSVKLLMAKLQYAYPNNPYIFIVGAIQGEGEEIVNESALMAQQIIAVTPPECKNALPSIELAQEYKKLNQNITNVSSVEEAVEIATILADKETVIVAFGTTAILDRYRTIVLGGIRNPLL